MRSKISSDAGAVAIVTAVMAVLLFSLAALVVDLGVARDSRRQAQNTADAASLAAANALYASAPTNLNAPGDFAAAVAAAKDYATRNYGTTAAEWAACSNPEALAYVYPGTGTNCISFDRTPYPSNVLVEVPLRKQPSIFGGVIGYSGVQVSAIAQARVAAGGQLLCTFCVLSDTTHVLQNGNLNVTGGNIWINGDVDIGPTGIATSVMGPVAGEDGVFYDEGGSAYVSGDISGNSPKFQNGQGQPRSPKIVDPLAATVLPFATQLTLSPKVNPCLDGPGIYGGYSQNNSACTLQPGLYVFTDDVSFAGKPGSTFVANGVTMYFTCGTSTSPQPCHSPGELGGGIDLSGNGSVTLSPPLKSTNPTLPEELYGFSIVYDRYNNASIQMTGNGSGSIAGTIYAVNATLDFRGRGGSQTVSSWVVVGDLVFKGTNATLSTNFDSSRNRRPSDGGRGLVR